MRILYDSLLLLRYQPLILANPRIIKNQKEILNVCTDAAIRLINRFDVKEGWGLPVLRDWYVNSIDILFSSFLIDYIRIYSMITQAAAIFLQNCNNENDMIRLQARKNLERCAKLYKRDDIVNRSRNAIILNEIVGQLSSSLETDMNTTAILQHTVENNQQQQLLLTCGNQFVDSYNEVLQVQELYPVNYHPSSTETNL